LRRGGRLYRGLSRTIFVPFKRLRGLEFIELREGGEECRA
jgi:hypothetical protein